MSPNAVRALFRLVLLAVFVAVAAGYAAAQDRGAATAGAIDAARAELDRIEGRLQDQNINDKDLAALRERTDPLSLSVEDAISKLTPQLAEADQRLAQIGPKPAEGAPAESEDVTKERDAQTAARQKLDETIKRGRLLQVEAAQVGDQITQRRRALLAQRLFERSRSVVDPTLWLDVIAEAPRDFRSVQALADDWGAQISRNLGASSIVTVVAAWVVAILLLFPGRRWVSNFGERLVVKQAPQSRLRRSATAMFRLVATTLAPLLSALVFFWALKSAGWMPAKVEPLASSLVRSAGFLGFAHGMMRALLAPGRPSWRLTRLSDEAIAEIKNQPLWVALVFVIGRIFEQFNGAVVASLSASIATSGLFAALNAATFAIALRGIRRAEHVHAAEAGHEKEESEGLGRPALFIARLVAWGAIGTVLIAIVTGYIALGQFLANQVIWISAVFCLAYLLLVFVNDFFTTALSSESSFGRKLSDGLGVRVESLEQIGVILSGVVRLLLMGVAALLVLAPWGLGSTDLFGWMRLPLTGFEIGGITIQPAAILTAAALIFVGFALTHAVQRWLDRDLLPKTRMDPGLKASVNTSVGYVGAILVVVAAVASLGFSLDRLAIVAGALSVGVGFGLQAIISNFVSGVILLAERPIKAGDWIVIGSDQGNVKRISVRSTEIELFDRSTLIVPNSDFITKSVKNVTHGSPVGRVQITLTVSAAADPEKVRQIAVGVAKAHSSILKFPEPQLTFTALGKTDNEFLLTCNVPSPRQCASVLSDLNFALVKAFAAEGVALGGPAAPSLLDAADRIGRTLAEALGKQPVAQKAESPSPDHVAEAPPITKL